MITRRPFVTASHAQLSNRLSSEALFYTCIIPFIAFFGAFAALMYPMRDALHPTGACWLSGSLKLHGAMIFLIYKFGMMVFRV